MLGSSYAVELLKVAAMVRVGELEHGSGGRGRDRTQPRYLFRVSGSAEERWYRLGASNGLLPPIIRVSSPRDDTDEPYT